MERNSKEEAGRGCHCPLMPAMGPQLTDLLYDEGHLSEDQEVPLLSGWKQTLQHPAFLLICDLHLPSAFEIKISTWALCLFTRLRTGDWRDVSTAKSNCCSSRGPEFRSQNLHSDSQPSVPEDLIPSDAHINVQGKKSYSDEIKSISKKYLKKKNQDYKCQSLARGRDLPGK